MIDYNKSIMEIVEAHLSPTPTFSGSSVGGESVSGTNRDIDAAIAEAGASEYAGGLRRKAPFITRKAKINRR